MLVIGCFDIWVDADYQILFIFFVIVEFFVDYFFYRL